MRMLSRHWHSATIPKSFFQYGNPSSEMCNCPSAPNLCLPLYTPHRLCTSAACAENEPPMGMTPQAPCCTYIVVVTHFKHDGISHFIVGR